MTTVRYLEIRDPEALRRKDAPAGFEVAILSPPQAELNQQLYRSVGRDWEWTDRLAWSEDDWHGYVQRADLKTWLGKMNGQTVGYFELENQQGGDVEIVYFGLLPEFIGQGFGGPLLSAAIERAWLLPATRRLWVHTCTKDHQYALDNYCKRGFEVYKSEVLREKPP
ncbi:MAG: GNAT family N-acetyltransferase [Planctomycetales bacterium]